jgi:RNA-directed DNA polymerase
VKRRTDRKRLTRKLHTVRTEQRRRMHAPLPDQHRWLCSVLRGHYRYYGLPSNWHAMNAFYDEVCRGWYRALRRRSQRGLTWERFNQWLTRFPLPRAHIGHSREALAG